MGYGHLSRTPSCILCVSHFPSVGRGAGQPRPLAGCGTTRAAGGPPPPSITPRPSPLVVSHFPLVEQYSALALGSCLSTGLPSTFSLLWTTAPPGGCRLTAGGWWLFGPPPLPAPDPDSSRPWSSAGTPPSPASSWWLVAGGWWLPFPAADTELGAVGPFIPCNSPTLPPPAPPDHNSCSVPPPNRQCGMRTLNLAYFHSAFPSSSRSPLVANFHHFFFLLLVQSHYLYSPGLILILRAQITFRYSDG